jgi:glucose/arabinose dehydrogenase
MQNRSEHRAIESATKSTLGRLGIGVGIALVVTLAGAAMASAEPVALQLARAEDRARFRVTTFAAGLGYPTSMATLADGSLLVATSDGGRAWLDNYVFASTQGALVRLTDTDGDGVADGAPQTMAAGLPGLVTSVRRVGSLVFALSSQGGAEAVTMWRTGATAADPFTLAGRLSFSFPAGFEHTTYALAARPAVGRGVELLFNVGARLNSSATPSGITVGLTAAGGAAFPGGVSQTVVPDAIHRVIVNDDGSAVTVTAPLQIARGLRNAAGMVFDAAGNLWFEDNGIDTEGNRGVSFSADELNMISAAAVGVSVPDFGFSGTYTRYSDGVTVGPTAGISLSQVSFTPLAGEKSEGAVEVALAPGSFPDEFGGGFFVPFSGVFNRGGAANDENPVVFVNPATGARFHFIANQTMGHPNGVLASDRGLFLSDLNYTGRFGDPIIGGVTDNGDGIDADREGVVYLITPVPEPGTVAVVCGAVLTWFGRRRRCSRA